MRTAPILLAALTLSACSASRPAVGPAEGTPLLQVQAPPTAPRPVPAAEIVPIPEPGPVPEAPRGSIEGRAVYPDPGYVDWALANGMTVVYKQVPGLDRSVAHAFAPGSDRSVTQGAHRVSGWPMVHIGSHDDERLLAAVAPSLGESLRAMVSVLGGEWTGVPSPPVPWGLVLSEGPHMAIPGVPQSPTEGPSADHDASAEVVSAGPLALRSQFRDPATFTVVLVGADDPVVAEALVGTTLGRLPARVGTEVGDLQGRPDVGSVQPAVDGPGAGIDLDTPGAERDVPVLEVLAAVVRDRLQAAGHVPTLHAHVHPRTGTVRFSVYLPDLDPEAATVAVERGLSAFTDAEVQRARSDAASAFVTPGPHQWLRLLADLYRVDGAHRPARNPAELSRYSARIAAVSASSVRALADRLRQSLPRSSLPAGPAR